MRTIRLVIFFLTIALLAAFTRPVKAEDEIEVVPVDYTFNEEITFQARFHSDVPVELAIIFFQREGDTQTFVELAAIKKLENGDYEIKHVHPISKHRFQAFTNIEYRFEILKEGGDFYKSPVYEFLYTDNRFEWDSLQEGPFIVYWFEGDYAFAQTILDVAQESLNKINGLIPLPEPNELHIYIYPDAQLMQEALKTTGQDWIAGHAFPDLQTLILYLTPNPDQILDIRQRIPHEIMHIMLYQSTKQGYSNIPVWLSEGLSSIAELYPNQDYPILLANAAKNNALYSISSLCEGFPRDAAGALLAYAQSASFTQFLFDRYGTSGLQKLVANYANGLNCENGMQAALGSGLEQLERQWLRETLSVNQARSALINLLPWLMVLLFVLIAPFVFVFRSQRSKSRTTPRETEMGEVTSIQAKEGG